MNPPDPKAQLIEGTYRVIYADPPWRYNDKTLRFGEKRRTGDAGSHAQYPTMSLEEICALNIPAAKESYLFLWVTNPLIREGFIVMEAWGFDYKTMLTWVKPSIRLGYYFRSRTEHLLFGTKGKPGRLLRCDLPNIIEAPVTKHSRKPNAFYDHIEAACTGPYLEMFARQRRAGWDVWGHEAPNEVTPMERRML